MTDCIIWTGAVREGGYGISWLNGRTVYAHRAAWEQQVGHLRDGYELHHTCRRRACVNVAHLLPVSPEDHHEIHSLERTECKNGHPYTEETTYIAPRDGARVCRICQRDAMRRHRERKKVAA